MMNRLPVWIDGDPGVDDAAAIFVAHDREELQIVGISAVAGNAPLDITTKNALCLCDMMQADYPVYRGASGPLMRAYEDGADFHGADGMGGTNLPAPKRSAETQSAWDALYEEAKKHDGKLEVVAMGPLTNIALALSKYPDLKNLIHRIAIMGGSVTRGNRTPCAEYNIFADPDAAQIVFRSGVKVVMCPLEVTEQAYLTAQELEALRTTEKGEFYYQASKHILAKNLEAGHEGFCIHDVCPVLYLAREDIFKGEDAGVFVETQSNLTLGKTVCDLYSDKQFDVKNTFVALEIDREAFVEAVSRAMK
ncbi:MAG: nucleoside hydrolase [Ruminococcaceae bacterium]|nr:nucleoside hydrolase [Oscillospiraceae bacterium]